MRRAFVAGATGYTGRFVVRELLRRGVLPVAHVRPDSPRLEEWRARFRGEGAEVDTTPWADDALRVQLGRLAPAFVFALLGTTRARARAAQRQGTNATYEAVDYGLTAKLLEATRASASSARFIYLSAIGVSGPSRNPYMNVRWRLESELRESGLSYVIAQPSFITGVDREEYRRGERLGAAAADAVLRVLGRIGFRGWQANFRSLTGPQLAHALVTAALDDSLRNRVLKTPELAQLADV